MRGPRSHPVVVLRWLRVGVLSMVALTALLYLVVADRAGEQVTAATRTHTAIVEIGEARTEAGNADDSLEEAARTGALDLTGPGAKFTNATTHMGTLLTSATEGNAAGERGLHHIQFVQGQLTTCVQLANRVVSDGRQGVLVARQALNDAPERDGRHDVLFTGGLKESLEDLREIETDALGQQLRSHWLAPGLLWPLLLVPTLVMLLLVGAADYVVARHFRRRPNPAAAVALLATASVAVITCLLCRVGPGELDGRRPLLPGEGWVMAIMLPLLVAAGALVFLAYRPRIAEYRFPRS